MIVVEVVVELAILMTMVVAVVVYDSGGTGIGGGVGDGGDDGYYFRNLSRTSGALLLIKSAPNLITLVIWVYGAAEIAEAVSEYLKTPACLNQPLNKLKHVTLALSGASESGLTFTKLLLSRTPSLVRMRTHGYKSSGYEEELLRFPRASPKAKLIIT
ncbi:hypothetical protein CQW23_29924 [Capsicum baccatum]|uniref:Uncharacterized protein n=1 Tax=Capsicum baccatum TaxID=33114 RepID=A0A2G2VBV3_CAPBA|nr:hypothetical protein CQW23_29924 [Capsicum baccatum]